MACIDKTYTSSWKDYEALKSWAKDKIYNCPNGAIINMNDCIYNYDKEDFEGQEIPVMNTTESEDYFLIKYCPLKFVQQRMRAVYNEDYINDTLNGNSDFDKPIIRGTKVKQIFTKFSWSQNYNKPLKQHRRPFNFFVDAEFMWYNEDLDVWRAYNEFDSSYGTITSTARLKCKSMKAVIRKLLKWNFPKNTKIHVSGTYIGEMWTFVVK